MEPPAGFGPSACHNILSHLLCYTSTFLSTPTCPPVPPPQPPLVEPSSHLYLHFPHVDVCVFPWTFKWRSQNAPIVCAGPALFSSTRPYWSSSFSALVSGFGRWSEAAAPGSRDAVSVAEVFAVMLNEIIFCSNYS